MGFRVERHPKEKATYLVPGHHDDSKIFSVVCGSVAMDFSIPRDDAGVFYVSDAKNGSEPSEYESSSLDFDVTVEGLRAARICISQKSVPAKRFDLDEILESNMYKKTADVSTLERRGGMRFHIAYDRDGYAIGVAGMAKGRCILLGFILLERYASKSGLGCGKTLERFGPGAHIR